jgi:hypothetical protein
MLIGDLITAVNNQPIADPEMIEQLMVVQDGTQTVEVTVMRNGQPLQFTVQPLEVLDNGLTTTAAIQEAFATQGVTGFGNTGGLLVDPFGATLTDGTGGVLVDGVQDQLLGGLLPNDMINGINGQPIRTREELLQALNQLPQNGDTFPLDVMRNGERVTLDVPFTALGDNFGNNRVGTQTSTRGNTGLRTGANGLQQGTRGGQGAQQGVRATQRGTTPAGTAVDPRTGVINPRPNNPGTRGTGTGTRVQQPTVTPPENIGRSAAAPGGIGGGRSAAARGGAVTGGTGGVRTGRSAAAQGGATIGTQNGPGTGTGVPTTTPPAGGGTGGATTGGTGGT